MNVAVVQFLGATCDLDAQYAFEKLGAPVSFCSDAQKDLPRGTDLVVLPGGFSYGDYLRPGAIAALRPIMESVRAHAKRGGLVLGICNGFQILLEAGLLPGAMLINKGLKFISRLQHLRVQNTDNALLSGFSRGELIRLPVAHAHGNYYASEQTRKELENSGQILLTYASANGESADLNGSAGAIAGICNKQKNVFALMPHPERALDLASQDGTKCLQGLLS